MMDPNLKKVLSKYEGKVNLIKVDVDQLQDLAMEYGVSYFCRCCCCWRCCVSCCWVKISRESLLLCIIFKYFFFFFFIICLIYLSIKNFHRKQLTYYIFLIEYEEEMFRFHTIRLHLLYNTQQAIRHALLSL